MKPILFRGASVWGGSGAAAFPADVLVEGDRIKSIARASENLSAEGATGIEARGRTLMPGLVEGHAHISFGGAIHDSDLGNIPPEEHVLLTVRNAKTLLDHGFTSAYSAATSKLRLDVVIHQLRMFIKEGRCRARILPFPLNCSFPCIKRKTVADDSSRRP